ncbi:hypothetical protein MASR2M64_02960 [Candidatus Cloacimonadota bacterium]|jgi:hypothetical protein|nr:hypothetical protein [Candidatus Cloacimonadota bacterium]MDD3236073.1 hypothetical protein [Candidatus Cloacimonadota bacterium]
MKENSSLVKELATRINKVVNIPLINEDNEQVFFELVVAILLDIFFKEMDKQIF